MRSRQIGLNGNRAAEHFYRRLQRSRLYLEHPKIKKQLGIVVTDLNSLRHQANRVVITPETAVITSERGVRLNHLWVELDSLLKSIDGLQTLSCRSVSTAQGKLNVRLGGSKHSRSLKRCECFCKLS